jgi:hypothetical protein
MVAAWRALTAGGDVYPAADKGLRLSGTKGLLKSLKG